jgi:hypothetical protein
VLERLSTIQVENFFVEIDGKNNVVWGPLAGAHKCKDIPSAEKVQKEIDIIEDFAPLIRPHKEGAQKEISLHFRQSFSSETLHIPNLPKGVPNYPEKCIERSSFTIQPWSIEWEREFEYSPVGNGTIIKEWDREHLLAANESIRVEIAVERVPSYQKQKTSGRIKIWDKDQNSCDRLLGYLQVETGFTLLLP